MLRVNQLEVTQTFPSYWKGAFAEAAGSGRPNVLIIGDFSTSTPPVR